MSVLTMKLARKLGLDRAVAYTLVGRAWCAIAVPITMLCVACFLSPSEQGFYYTFTTGLALQAVFELGLSVVILQFASHEKAELTWTKQRTLEGSPKAKSRVASLFRISLAWYGGIAALSVAILLPGGLWFFKAHGAVEHIVWRIPWICLVFATAGTLLLSPIFAVLEGCGLVAQVAQIRVYQFVLAYSLLWATLRYHGKLFAGPVYLAAMFFAGALLIFIRYRGFLIDLLKQPKDSDGIHWLSEIWPFQWRIALSWLSGYLIFQIFNPVLFRYHGPSAAGRMGMSLTAMQGISTIAMAWIYTKAAPFGVLIAKKSYDELDRIFFASARMVVGIAILGTAILWSGSYFLQHLSPPLHSALESGHGLSRAVYYLHFIGQRLGERMLPPLPLALLALTIIANSLVFAEAVYLRAHKQEPFLGISVLSGMLIAVLTFLLGKPYGALGIMAGYLFVTLTVSLVGGTWIFIDRRKNWHILNTEEM